MSIFAEYPQDVLESVKLSASRDKSWELDWIDGRVLGTDLVLVYRFSGGSVTYGILADLVAISGEYEPVTSVEHLATRVLEGLVESGPSAYLLDVDWAEGLVEDFRAIVWRGLDSSHTEVKGHLTVVEAEPSTAKSSSRYSGSWEASKPREKES